MHTKYKYGPKEPFPWTWKIDQQPYGEKFFSFEGYWNDAWHYHMNPKKSWREDHFVKSHYIAEFWCAVSNIGFLIVGLLHGNWAIFLAGVCSFWSHAVPYQHLLWLDKFMILVVFADFAQYYKCFLAVPWIPLLIPLTGIINAMDAFLARNYGMTWPHVFWHLSSALIAHIFLSFCK